MDTTTAEFERFEAVFNAWVEIFGLKDWEIHFKRKEIEEYSCIEPQAEDCLVVVTLSTKWPGGEAPCPATCAKHEAIHLLLARLTYLSTRAATDAEVGVEEERLVRILEKALPDPAGFSDYINPFPGGADA